MQNQIFIDTSKRMRVNQGNQRIIHINNFNVTITEITITRNKLFLLNNWMQKINCTYSKRMYTLFLYIYNIII